MIIYGIICSILVVYGVKLMGEITIKNCNNIDLANIEVVENQLNIKYGINGTGKTTIARAIEYAIYDKNNQTNKLTELTPFKYIDNENEDLKPKVSKIENLNSIYVFNEEYVNKYVFLEDEILKNSFEVFVKNDNYEKIMNDIEELTISVRNQFKEDTDLNKLISDLIQLSECFGKSKTGYSASSSIGKGFKDGNKLIHIPKELEVYEEYLKNDLNIKWLKWQMTGKEYLDIGCKCPYCASDVMDKKETILKVSKEYDSKMVEHLNKVLEVFNSLSRYFTDETNKKINEITQSIGGISKEQIEYLKSLKGQIDILLEKLQSIKALNFFALKDVDKIIDVIKSYKIDIRYLSALDTEETRNKVNEINLSLDDILSEAGRLQGKINQQKKLILATIEEYKTEINEFLKYAGYKYYVNIELRNNEYKMILHHENILEQINQGNLHLSYGEKNAFALILFMYEAISKSPDLIVLDDPISSFDKNKKFAIINKLFKGVHSLKNNTILMLTHDFDPIVDMMLNFKHIFNEIPPNACFLENKCGIISEKRIEKKDIKTFIEIAKENIDILDDNINKLIYLRRLYEINDSKGLEWNLLSNLFHKRKEPEILKEIHGESRRVEMTDEEINNATNKIREYINDFNYYGELDKVLNKGILIECYKNSQNNYEKLQIYRIINNENSSNDVVKKFVNQTFHVDNDYLFQLNPCIYEIIPHYIIDECNKDLNLVD